MATSTTFNITTGVTTFTCTFVATDAATVKCFIVSTGVEIDANDYTISGRSASSTGSYIVIDWPDAGDYVGEQLIVRKYVDIDTGAPADAMLSDFTTVAQASREVLQNEFAALYGIIGDITGGSAVGTYDIADIGTLIARLNDLADDIFTTTTNSGTPAVWDGTNTLSIGGDSNVQSILTTHETRLDTAETDIDNLQATDVTHTAQLAGTTSSGLQTSIAASIASLQDQINSNVGLPTTVASGQAEAADSASTIQVLAVNTLGALEYIDLRAQVGPAPITDTGGYFTTDTVNAALQQLGASLAGGIVWVAGGYFLLETQGGVDPAAAATQYNDPAANTTPIRTGNTDGGTSAHATNWIVMSDTNANSRVVIFLPTDVTAAGYSADDFELSMLECTDTGTGAVRVGTTNIGAYTIEAKSDGSAFYIGGPPAAGGFAVAITIKRVRTL